MAPSSNKNSRPIPHIPKSRTMDPFNRALSNALPCIAANRGPGAFTVLRKMSNQYPVTTILPPLLRRIAKIAELATPDSVGLHVLLRCITRGEARAPRIRQLWTHPAVRRFLWRALCTPGNSLSVRMVAFDAMRAFAISMEDDDDKEWHEVIVQELGGPRATARIAVDYLCAWPDWRAEATGFKSVYLVASLFLLAMSSGPEAVEEMLSVPSRIKTVVAQLRDLCASCDRASECTCTQSCVIDCLASLVTPSCARKSIGARVAMEAMGRDAGLVGSLVRALAEDDERRALEVFGALSAGRPRTLVKTLMEVRADEVLRSRGLLGALKGEGWPRGEGCADCDNDIYDDDSYDDDEEDLVEHAVHVVFALYAYGGRPARVLVRTNRDVVEALRTCAELGDKPSQLAQRVLRAIDARLAMECAGCGMTEDGSGRVRGVCKACKGPAYCGRACQRVHWEREHKKTCCWRPRDGRMEHVLAQTL